MYLIISIYKPLNMAPRNNTPQPQAQVLYNYLGNFQLVHLLTSWVNAVSRFEELKIDHSSFKQMRREKLIPKRLGRVISKANVLEPFTAIEDQAVADLIKETASCKGQA